MSLHSKGLRRFLMLTGIMIFALSISVFGAELTPEEALLSAIENAGSGSKITLSGDVDFGSGEDYGIIIPTGKNLTLDLNGYEIISSCEYATILVSKGASLTILDSTSGDKGGVINNYRVEEDGDIVAGESIRNIGTLIINDGTYKAYDYGYMYAINAREVSTTIINGGIFYGIVYTNGYATASDLTINDGTFNKMLYLAGSGDYLITSGEFSVDSEKVDVEIDSNAVIEIKRGTLEITGGSFEMNIETSNHDGIEIGKSGSGNYVGTIIATKIDGYAGDTKVSLKGGTFKNSDGAALVLANQSNIYDVSFEVDGANILGDLEIFESGDGEETLTITSGTIKELSPVAKVGSYEFNSLERAIEFAKENETVTLKNHVELEKTLEIIGKKISIDLNSFSISASEKVIVVKNSHVEFTGEGSIYETDPNHGGIVIYGSTNENDVDYSKVIVGKDVSITAWAPIFVSIVGTHPNYYGYGVTVDVYGALNGEYDRLNDEGNGIYVNGSIMHEANCPVINIHEDAVINSVGVGIYGAGYAKWNINNALIEGVSSGLGIKAGKWIISGDKTTIKATGDNTAPTEGYSNGINSSGAAIQIESNKKYAGNIEINIDGAIVDSKNGYSIYEYLNSGDTETKVNQINILNGKFKGDFLISEELDLVKKEKVLVSGGYYTENPTEYLVEGIVAVKSDDANYEYMIGNKEVEVNSTTEALAPSVEVLPELGEIREEDFAVKSGDIESIASSLANSEDVVGDIEIVTEVLVDAGICSGDYSGDVTVVVQPFIDVKIKSGDILSSGDKVITLEITAKYNVVVTTVSGDTPIVTSGDGKNATVWKENQPLDVSGDIEITVGLPEGFASGDSTIYVYHEKIKEGKKVVYVYDARVAADGRSATFVNKHGFSSFELRTKNGIAKNTTTGNVYASLKDAISEVNNNTIILLGDSTENVAVNKEVTFTINKDTFEFNSGDITAATGYKLTITEVDTNNFKYAFEKITTPTTPSSPVGGGGSSTREYRITVGQKDGGSISPTTLKVERGENQKFVITSDEGYEIKDVIVDGKSVGAVKEYTFENVKNTHSITAEFVKVSKEWSNPFEDVKEADWYYNSVKFVSENGLFNGIEIDEFGPEITMTRGMLVTVLYRYAKADIAETSTFDDVDAGMYYSKPIAWATKNGIVNGIGDNKFGPDKEITRAELVTMLYRYAVAMKMDVSAGENTNILSYDDFDEIPEYAISAFQWACGAGVINGRTESTLVPQGNAKRCEVATMIQRFCEE